MGSLNQSRISQTTIDKGPMSYVDQPSESAETPEIASTKRQSEAATCEQEHAINQSTEPPTSSVSCEIVQQICNYWYHGRCEVGEGCIFVHRLEPSLPFVRGQTVKHKKPCGLDRCRWKDEVPYPKKKKNKKQARQDSVTGANGTESTSIDFQNLVDAQFRAKDEKKAGRNQQQNPGQKRKFQDFHWDDPRQWGSGKGNQIDYDDESAPTNVAPADPDVDENPSTNIAPTDPEDEWSWIKEAKVKAPPLASAIEPRVNNDDDAQDIHSTDALVPEPTRTEKPVAEALAPPAKKRKVVSKRAKNETCFFWYHGTCSSLKGVGGKSTCPRLHELTDPPSMVQPPPGYVHRELCAREWCPGDARQSGRTEDKGQSEAEPEAEGEGDDAYSPKLELSDGEGEDSEEDWFLTGFD